MIDILKKFFSKNEPAVGPHEKDETHDIRIATCAIFLEMANIDGEFSQPERDHIIQTMKSTYGLAHEDVLEILEASEKELEGSIDLWQFTNLINRNYSLEEKIQIIEMAWGLAYTDGLLDQHEDYMVHKLANLLRLSHKQLIDAKLKVLH